MSAGQYLLGLDIGSSSVKASLLDAETGAVTASASSPDEELAISSPAPGFAEQDPELWWTHVVRSMSLLKARSGAVMDGVAAIGISYQMHGLVIVDVSHRPLRPAIIWCDSRAVGIGDDAFARIGGPRCMGSLLNSPGNFTASKLRWVKEHEPDVYARVHKMMLPGDYIAMKLTGEIRTTPSGLSEGILWDFGRDAVADMVLDDYGIARGLLPGAGPSFSVQGTVTRAASKETGLPADIPVSYRAGDQPNNAFSLKVLGPGEAAATAGTSGVVYGVTDAPRHDPKSRVNVFLHVNHSPDAPRLGVLLCINGTGILNRWLKENTGACGYDEMNAHAAATPPGAQGLVFLPYGNGAERTLGNRLIGASLCGLDLNRHRRAHMLRAAQEGIVFSLQYGIGIMRAMGVRTDTVRAGLANMFLSPLFCEAFVNVTGARLELYNTDGAQGAARGAGVGAGIYRGMDEAFRGLDIKKSMEPDEDLRGPYLDAYERWLRALRMYLDSNE